MAETGDEKEREGEKKLSTKLRKERIQVAWFLQHAFNSIKYQGQ